MKNCDKNAPKKIPSSNTANELMLISAPNRPYKKPGLARLVVVRPNAQCSVDCNQLGIDRGPRAAVNFVHLDLSILSLHLRNLLIY